VRQQPALDRERIAVDRMHESAERAQAPNDPMTRDDERDVVGPARTANRARRRMYIGREFA
jgi:hypothetical protein